MNNDHSIVGNPNGLHPEAEMDEKRQAGGQRLTVPFMKTAQAYRGLHQRNIQNPLSPRLRHCSPFQLRLSIKRWKGNCSYHLYWDGWVEFTGWTILVNDVWSLSVIFYPEAVVRMGSYRTKENRIPLQKLTNCLRATPTWVFRKRTFASYHGRFIPDRGALLCAISYGNWSTESIDDTKKNSLNSKTFT